MTLLFFLWRGNARNVVQSKRFVIIQPTGNLGDMVCTTPMFRAIKRHIPDAYVTVVGAEKNRALLKDNPDVDAYIDASTPFWSLVKQIRSGNYDAGISINPDTINMSTLFLGNVHGVSSIELPQEYKHVHTKSYRLIAWLMYQVVYVPGTYIPDQYVRLLAPFGIRESTSEKILGCTLDEREKSIEVLKSAGIQAEEKCIAIAPGAGSESKQWPAKRFAMLANHIYAAHRTPVIIIGGASDTRAVRDMVASLHAEVRYYAPGPQSLTDLKAVLAHVDMVIGNDSGAIHIGEALGTKTLTIVGVTDVAEHMREDGRHRIVMGNVYTKEMYRSCVSDEAKIDTDWARQQMALVTVDMVAKCVDELIRLGSVV